MNLKRWCAQQKVMLKFFAVFIVAAAIEALADLPRGEVTLSLNNGSVLVGRVTAESAQGYTIETSRGRKFVAFSDIADMRENESIDNVTPPTAPAKEKVTVADAALTPRKRVRVGIGAGVFVVPAIIGPMFHVNVPLGRVSLRISPTVFIYALPEEAFVMTAIDLQARFHVTDWYSFGGGVFTGVAWAGGYGTRYFLGPSVSPAVFSLGAAKHHEIGAWLSFPLAQVGELTYYFGPASPIPMLTYAFLF
mgnify:CR=1 FL=1